MEIFALIAVVLGLTVLLALDDRARRRGLSHRLDPRTQHQLDREADRIRLQLVDAPQALASQPLWRSRSQRPSGPGDDWTFGA